jgi:6-phosphogluconolactonase
MTLTLPRILASKQIFVHITGEKKRQVYLKALEKGPIASLPIRAILKQNDTPVTVYWAP